MGNITSLSPNYCCRYDPYKEDQELPDLNKGVSYAPYSVPPVNPNKNKMITSKTERQSEVFALNDYTKSIEMIIRIQAVIRGHLVRNNYNKQKRTTLNLKKRVDEMKDVKVTSTKEKVENGEVHIVYTDGTEYKGKSIMKRVGEIKNELQEGKGTQKWADGAIYTGEWKNGFPWGMGKFVDNSGNVFEGEWKNGLASGKGKYTKNDGTEYTGDWVANLPHGKGIEKFIDGEVYVGDYEYGNKKGKGTYTSADGTVYEGDWNNNKIEGHVLYLHYS
jgi:hypothetical protein